MIEEEARVTVQSGDKTAGAIPVKMVKPKNGLGRLNPSGERRIINLLVSLSAVLVLVCFIMGAGLIQNEGRISTLEEQLVLLTTSYRDLVALARDGGTESVFASQREGAAQPQPEEAPETQAAAETDVALETEMDTSPVVSEEHAEEMPQPVLVSPTPEPTPQPTPEPVAEIPETYMVEAGDSLIFISLKFYGTSDMVSAIMELNGMDNPDMLQSGRELRLPR